MYYVKKTLNNNTNLENVTPSQNSTFNGERSYCAHIIHTVRTYPEDFINKFKEHSTRFFSSLMITVVLRRLFRVLLT